MDCSLLGSSVSGIFQARILEWIAISTSLGDLPHPGIEPTSPALAGEFCTTEPPGKSRNKDKKFKWIKESFLPILKKCSIIKPNFLLLPESGWFPVSKSSSTTCKGGRGFCHPFVWESWSQCSGLQMWILKLYHFFQIFKTGLKQIGHSGVCLLCPKSKLSSLSSPK